MNVMVEDPNFYNKGSLYTMRDQFGKSALIMLLKRNLNSCEVYSVLDGEFWTMEIDSEGYLLRGNSIYKDVIRRNDIADEYFNREYINEELGFLHEEQEKLISKIWSEKLDSNTIYRKKLLFQFYYNIKGMELLEDCVKEETYDE